MHNEGMFIGDTDVETFTGGGGTDEEDVQAPLQVNEE